MITPFLEKKIHEGKAQYKTFVLGVSALNVLPVTPGTYIVITDLFYMPFTNVPEADNQSNIGDIWKNSNKQLELRSQKSVNHYVFRDGLPFAVIPQKLDTYLVHTSNVSINFLVIPSLTDNVMQLNNGSIPTTTDIIKTPSGYGNMSGETRSVLLEAPGQQYIPTGAENMKTVPIVPASDYRQQLKVDYTDATRLKNLVDPIWDGYLKDRAYPILNVGYVFVNEEPTEFLQSS